MALALAEELALPELLGGFAIMLLDQAKRSFGQQAAAGRTRLHKEWRAVQESLEAMPAVRPPTRKRRR